MRFVLFVSFCLVASAELAAQNAPKFSASVSLLHSMVVVGDEPLAILKITNESAKRAFIDQFELATASAVQYQDRSGRVSGSKGRVVHGATDGATTGRINRLRDSTVGIEPGQSLIRLVRVLRIEQAGKVSIGVYAYFPATTDLESTGEDWPDISVKSELDLDVVPSGKGPTGVPK